jgi:alpha-glucuronidase
VQRYTDYARLLSSIGLNAVVWDNVNACGAGNEQLLASANLALLAPLAAAFYSLGLHSLLTPCWSSPQTVGGLPTSDPRDPRVSAWWDAKLREVSETLGGGGGGGAFRGLLFKGDTEGQPGPNDDNMTELEGANIFGAKLAPLGGVCIWRAFSHPPGGRDMPVDQALYQFERFAGFENATLPNVVVQIKNGPYDFQVREPVHALFGRLPHVSLLLEVEVTPEYLGQNYFAIGLPWQWESYLNFDLGLQPGVGGGAPCASTPSTLLGVVAGGPLCNPYSGVAGVSNFGVSANWTGHFLGSANTYGFGRQAWAPASPASAIVGEWAETVFAGSAPGAADAVVALLADSWPAYENVTALLGYGFVCGGNHFDMDPALRVDYSNATRDAIGYNRGAPGAYAESYNGAVAAAFMSPETCPEELLLAFHNVPYSWRLRDGSSVLERIYASHAAGAAASQGFVGTWRQLQGRVAVGALVTTETPTEADVFAAALTRLEQGAASAATVAGVMEAYFRNLTL